MLNKNLLAFASIALLAALPLPALSESQEQLVERYTTLAGSKHNATSLVTGLRDGKEVKLSRRGSSTESFTPPTGKMGYGNVDNALALAEASLNQQGIAKPTPAQLEAALMGGTLTTASGKSVKLDGILRMRAEGKGWGQIANSLGIKLGELKRSDKAEPRATRPDRVAKAEKPQRHEKPARPEKPERPEKPR